jgi:hypothetical protein
MQEVGIDQALMRGRMLERRLRMPQSSGSGTVRQEAQ